MLNSGRDAFRRYEKAIVVLSRLLRLLPAPVRGLVWRLFDGFEGRISVGVRYCILRGQAGSIGRNVFIGRGVILKNVGRLVIGNDVSIHAGCYIDAYGGVEIGDAVSIAHQSSLVAFEHTWLDASQPIKYNPIRSAGIRIGNDVWVGCGVRILDGSQIPDRSIIAAGAVVKAGTARPGIYGGVPARFLRPLESETQ